ncbi:serine O-acetyltransferase [Sphingobacterium haloxyli]|uniref:Serine acetyltransferase n=1 Tax=Sphingobacterium haloxyli TaxID=2100533 RepID=A0A2S9J1Z7_9SPHI|nr:serine O-acetyltransferase [Sphingobacterium haloxyli]PRD46813.1 serine acetyltransferase [Sphingobacterium haloxyli]
MKEPNLIMKCIRVMYTLYKKKVPAIPKVIQWFIRVTCSADIPPNVKIGKGTVLKHNGLGVVLHEKAVIGENVTIMHNVTIGGRNGRGAPTIENNVFIGSGACILGNINIGENAMIGANAVVIKDVLANTVVGGVPSKFIKSCDEQE